VTGVAAPQPDRNPGNDTWVIVGWITVFLLPLAAVAIGIILWSRGDRRGIPITFAPMALIVIAIALGFAITPRS
jgi:hypothetical protein